MTRTRSISLRRSLQIGIAVLVPIVLTTLFHFTGYPGSNNYLYPYLGIVAIIGIIGGALPAFIAAGTSFLLVDYTFVPPVGTFTIADKTDLLNLLIFLATAGIIGFQSSRQLRAQHHAETLAANLSHANAHLEQLNHEQAEAAAIAVDLAQTQHQVEVLQRTDQLRRELIANVSHELRTPLTNLLMATTSLLDNPHLQESTRSTLRMIEGEEHRLARLVGDMLDLARLEAGALDLSLSEFSLGDAITTAQERFQRLHPDRHINVQATEEQLDVLADWDRVGQILDNMLSNAEKFAPQGTPITLTVQSGARGFAVVHIIDEGPGVPEEIRGSVFERFITNGHGDNTHGGVGLGLAIVKGLTEAQGGHAWIEEGEKSDFGFSLPLASHAGLPSIEV
ncbi:MAG: sensor histidine kinase [Candidatus Dormibacteria bacterium]